MSFLDQVEKQLDLPPGPKSEVMRELTSHYEEIREELLASGTPEAQVDKEAEQRLGSSWDVAARLSAVHNSASWKSAVLAAVPFIGSAACLFISTLLKSGLFPTVITIAIGLIMSAVAMREIVKSRRPVWLASWLAGALMAVDITHAELSVGFFGLYSSLLFLVITPITAWKTRRWLKPATALSVTGLASIACALFSKHNGVLGIFAVAVAFASSFVLLIYFARCVFERHPYGNSMQASLFIFAMLILKYLTVAEQSELVYFALGELMATGAVVWLARVPRYENKCQALWFGLFTWAFCAAFANALITGLLIIVVVANGFGALLSAALMYFIVSIPIRTPDSQPDHPQIAQ